ncbi:hypothetical protein [Dyella sp.]|uniref:DUF3472 domain-containing protein n=1 Tax=Dyella sp. TaxID=1869338 RepID=UPI002FD9611C
MTIRKRRDFGETVFVREYGAVIGSCTGKATTPVTQKILKDINMKRLTKLSIIASTFAMAGVAQAGFSSVQYGVHITNFVGGMSGGLNGFTELTYPITVLSGPVDRAMYYSQYIYFKNHTAKNEAYYYGIQPQGNGEALLIFSYFGEGARVIDRAHCSEGADYGNGITCNTVKVPFSLGTTYDFTATLVSGTSAENVWEGYVKDTKTGIVTKIGSWSTPAALGYLSGESIGFIEYYTGLRSCAEIPATTAIFGPGMGSLNNGAPVFGVVANAYGVGVCNGKVMFSSYPLQGGGQEIVQQQGVD